MNEESRIKKDVFRRAHLHAWNHQGGMGISDIRVRTLIQEVIRQEADDFRIDSSHLQLSLKLKRHNGAVPSALGWLSRLFDFEILVFRKKWRTRVLFMLP